MLWIFLVLYGLAGFCVLGLETAWIDLFEQALGGTVQSAAVVILVFFTVSAFGNRLGAAVARRMPRSAAAYGMSEICAALTAAAVPLLAPLVWKALPAAGFQSGSVVWLRQGLGVLLVMGVPALFQGISHPLVMMTIQIRRSWEFNTVYLIPGNLILCILWQG